MAYTLSNKCAKNLSKQTVLLQLIIKNVVTCFFGTQCIYMMSKKYTLSDNMCLVHISAIVMLTCVLIVVKVAYDVIRLEMLLYTSMCGAYWTLVMRRY